MVAANRNIEGGHAVSFYVEVPQLAQAAQLLQAMLGVGPAEQ